MAKSYYLDNASLSAALRNSAYTPPATVYIALYTAGPGPSGGGTEVDTSGTAYARTAVAFGAPSNGVCTEFRICHVRTGNRAMGNHCGLRNL